MTGPMQLCVYQHCCPSLHQIYPTLNYVRKRARFPLQVEAESSTEGEHYQLSKIHTSARFKQRKLASSPTSHNTLPLPRRSRKGISQTERVWLSIPSTGKQLIRVESPEKTALILLLQRAKEY